MDKRRGAAQQPETHQKLARPEGFEPPTNGFGSHYSIRLSYGRVEMRAGMGHPEDAASGGGQV